MTSRKMLQIVHVASTIWFVFCLVYLFVLALRQAGVQWWIIFGMSGYSSVVLFLLVSLYLFALYRGVSLSQELQDEHPFTGSFYYYLFYDITPFLGSVAGGISLLTGPVVRADFLVIVAGCLWMTFLVWVLVDPVLGLAEGLFPASRRRRRRRLAGRRKARRQAEAARQQLLEEALFNAVQERKRFDVILEPYARDLDEILAGPDGDAGHGQLKAVEIGLLAWQLGGLACMKQLHQMVSNEVQVCRGRGDIDYLAIWWDGIGDWRSNWFEGQLS